MCSRFGAEEARIAAIWLEKAALEKPASNLSDHQIEHLNGQPAGVHVVARTMIARTKCPSVGQVVHGTMNKWIDFSGKVQRPQCRAMRDAAEWHDDGRCGAFVDLRIQEGTAGIDLGPDRFVGRWDAAHRVCDATIDELETVVWSLVKLASRKAVTDERGIENITGIITGEGASCPVGTAQSWRETDDKKASVSWPERRNRRIMPVWKGFDLLVAEVGQSRAALTVRVGGLAQCHMRQRASLGNHNRSSRQAGSK